MSTPPLNALLTALFDYAGLFPPARLDMQQASETYARARMGDHAFMLGRFVCPASRLHKLSEAASIMMPGTHATSGYREHADILEPWGISAIMDGPLDECLELVNAFDEHHSVEEHGLARVESIELKAASPGWIDQALEIIPEDITPFFEIPIDQDSRGFVAALAGNDAAAKIRCGGVKPELIPPTETIAAFLLACHNARVPFKATAGLHHPLRAQHALTYEPDSPRGRMHGFVNVFLAAAALNRYDLDQPALLELLNDDDPDRYVWHNQSVQWHHLSIDSMDITRCRETFALSIGSCSFDEPIEDLQQLGWLDG